MASTIKCNKCQNQIEITEAIREELEAKVLEETKAKHQNEINKLIQEKENLKKAKEKEFEDFQKHITESIRKETIDKVRKEYDAKIESTKEESQAREKQNKELQNEIKELFKQLREIKDAKDKIEIEYEKKLLYEQDNIKQKAKKEAHEEIGLKLAEKDKQIEDIKKQLIEAQRKAEQGSQQLQGEVLELDLEHLLRDNFPHDVIEPVEKGTRGADVKQIVRSPKGYECGVILWETKRTKTWSDSWISKLKDDLRAEKANIPVIISSVLPKEIDNGLGSKDEVWISSFPLAKMLAILLRKNLLDVYRQKAILEYRGEKAEHLYEYITSHKFRQQVEAMVETYHLMKNQINKERVSYEKMWSLREKQVDKLFSSTANIIGNIQGEVGPSAFQIKGLELLEVEIEEDNDV
ncbi:MAG: DUF2130 domain-containing protein [Spirochaetota bacterium]|nr:DUF2130 domain-containing protein [Spirochaetota bacterium]